MTHSPTLGVIGAGRLGSALTTALAATGVVVTGVASRTRASAQALAERVGAPVLDASAVLAAAELTLLTVPDDALADTARDLASTRPNHPGAAVVHCSGATSVDVLEPLAQAGFQTGCWHVLQSVPTPDTSLKPVVLHAITATEPLRATLHALAESLQGTVTDIADADKTRYHAAAVLANNFSTTLVWHAVEALRGCGMSEQEATAALLPLMRDMLDNIATLGPAAALTGPVARGDVGTVAAHLEALADSPETQALYRACATATLPILATRGLNLSIRASMAHTVE